MIKRNIQITRVSRVADREPPPATRASYKYKLMFKYIIKFENSTHIANAKYKNSKLKQLKSQQLIDSWHRRRRMRIMSVIFHKMIMQIVLYAPWF